MRRCQYQHCQKQATNNSEGNKQAMYCKNHAEDGMVNVQRRRCSQYGCSKWPNFNIKGDKKPLYCKDHAKDEMVMVFGRSCIHDLCVKHASFNVEGTKKPIYCKQHAKDGMVNVIGRRCSHDACSTRPTFNVKGTRTGKYCKQHAKGGMVNVIDRRCLHDACSTQPSFNVKGTTTRKYCQTHAEDGMVNVVSKVCSRDSPARSDLDTRARTGRGRRTARNTPRKKWWTLVSKALYTTFAQRRQHGVQPLDVTATGDTIYRTSSLDGAAITPVGPCKTADHRKRCKSNLQVEILPNCVVDYRFKEGEVFQDVVLGDGAEGPLKSCHRALPRQLDDGTVGSAPEHTALGCRKDISPLPKTPRLRAPIKTEIKSASVDQEKEGEPYGQTGRGP